MSSWLLNQADMVEKMQGCGEAMTVTLDAKDYHEVSSEPILTALGKLRDSLHKLMSENSAQNPKAACSDDDKTFKRVRKSKEQNSPCSDLKEALKSTEPDTSKQDDPAQTSKDLWTYLTSSTRKEPVIGLSMITEYRNQNGQNSFLCSCCKVILSTSKYPGHLISPRHRFNYIKIKYPDFVAHWKAEISLTDNIKELQKKAQVVQDTEGWGCLKIVEKENKQPQKRSQEPSEDTENATLAKLKKQEPSNTSDAEKSAPNLELPQIGGGAEPQDQKNSEPKLKKQQQKKFTKRNAVIGLNFVTCVHHGKKKLFFCELCSVRGDFDHMSSVIHRKTYVKHKYPDWNASSPNMEKKLHKISLRLAAVERSTGRGMKKLNVTANVFIALSTAPLNEALSQLKLLQTKPEDGVEHNEPSTFSDHEQGTCNNSVDHLKSSATTANSLQQDESVLLGNHVIPAPVYEPISPPPASDCKSVPSVTPLYSSTHLTFLKLSNNLKWKEPSDAAHHETGPGADSGGAGGLQHSPSAFPCSPLCGHFTCCQSILKEENSLPLDNAPSKTYCFPNLPTVVGQSNASIFLGVKGLFNKDPIIGLANILECQAILQPTFFLCLNCAEKVSRENFCHHMTSERHIHLTIRTQYHEIFQRWQMTPHVTIRDFAEKLALTEKGLDAKVIKLTKTQYESLCSADFNDAIVILQRMYGPRLDKSSLPSHLGVQNQENHEISTVRLAARSVEAAKERENQSQQSCDKTTQNQEHHSVHVPLKEFNHALGNLGSKTTTCTSTDNHPQTESQNPPQTLPESDAQTAKPQHQVVVQIDLTAESDDSMTKLSIHTPKQITERAKEKHVKDCSNSTALETPQTAAVDVQESRPAPMFPCTATIKQEKTGHDEGSCGDDIPLTLEANSSKDPTGNIFKHSDLRYSNKNRTEADAVVGLSAMIECRCEGKASLYLCVSCSRKLNHDLFRYHLLKYRHRYSYLKKRYPSLFEDWSDSDSIPDWSMRLMRLAHKVEMTNEDEPGQLQVMKLNCNEYNEIKAMSYDKAITHLQKIRKEQNLCGLQTCISPKITEKLIKQERMETDVTTPYSSQLPELIAQESGRAFKRRAVEQDLPRQSFPGQKQASNVPFNHMNQSPPVGNNPEPSDCPAKRSKISGNDTDSVAQVQTESSNSTTINANFTPVIVTETSRSSPQSFDPSSMTYNGTGSVDKTVLKNSDGKESSLSIIAPQQKDSCPDASTINAIGPTKGLEIARLSEKRPLAKKSLSENAWNYENRQFSPEKNSMTNTNPMPDSSTEMVAMKKQCIPYSVHNYNQALNPHYNWQIPSKNPDPNLTNLHLSVVSGYGTPTSATSQMTPEYVVSPLYPMYMHSGYPSVSNTMAPEYLGPVEQKAINYQSAASCISTNGTNSANTNSAQTLHTVDQAQQVYQQIQSIQDPATCQAYYAWYSYNQTLHSNQAADNGNATSTPTFEHGVYPLFSWLQKKN
ncbi:uncharacterized protein LOC128518481 isoform X2 [Clarias gariepinus]|uniref:uncharacterized protein LOC128518481 isoform X2 n=1 Tax=Clarias gariepinus TaxID=13013 RepID=UPI00234D4582|nr:uncharacterized protein LOC128518481 isoform X2 [Clarias gariepinus]